MSFARGERRRNMREETDDPTVPLAFERGYIHLPCGGPAEKPNHPHLGMYCINEDRFDHPSQFKRGKAGQSTLVGGS